QLVEDTGDVFGRNHAKRGALAFETMERVPILLPTTSFSGERGQIDARLFAELDERQSHVGVAMQMLARDFIEHGDTAEVITSFEKQTRECVDAPRRPHGVAERRPRATLYAVHHERGLLVV